MSYNLEDIGLRLKKIRKILNKSQQALADETSLTKQAISNIENGKSAPGLGLLSKLLVDYNVNLNYLICGIGNVLNIEPESTKSLKDSILSEVENFLSERGIV